MVCRSHGRCDDEGFYFCAFSNLDLTDAIFPTTTMLLSTMPWPSGTTECLPGHSDGCMGNLTNGKYPYRVAGVEMQIGNYTEQLDPLWQASLVDDHWHYDVYSCRDSEKQAGSITANYEKTSSFDLPNANKWSWNYIRPVRALAFWQSLWPWRVRHPVRAWQLFARVLVLVRFAPPCRKR